MVSADFAYAFQRTLGEEGRYSNSPYDRGGRTMYGISERYHPEMWKHGPPNLLEAHSFYQREFWNPLRLDEITGRYARFVRAELFDTAVNQGTLHGVLAAQRALHLLGDGSVLDDGKIGPMTLSALSRRCDNAERTLSLLAAMNLFQGIRYVEIVKANPSQEANFAGWMKRLAMPSQLLAEAGR